MQDYFTHWKERIHIYQCWKVLEVNDF